MQRTVYWTQLDSPWGPMFLAGSEKAICLCEFLKTKALSHLLERLESQDTCVQIKQDPRPLATALDGLNRYFSNKPERLDHPVGVQGTPFQKEVWLALREIPLGQVASYGEIAARIGRPNSARAVGQACGSNSVVLFVPCHRVIAAKGKLGGFGSGLGLKEALLAHEGVRLEQAPGQAPGTQYHRVIM